MSLDFMKQVLDTEQDARTAQSKAAASARQMIAEAEASGKAHLTNTREAAEQAVAALMQEAELQGAQRTEEILLHAENQCAVLRAHGAQNLSRAADLIVERIVTD